jgi:hypothetical protein
MCSEFLLNFLGGRVGLPIKLGQLRFGPLAEPLLFDVQPKHFTKETYSDYSRYWKCSLFQMHFLLSKRLHPCTEALEKQGKLPFNYFPSILQHVRFDL